MKTKTLKKGRYNPNYEIKNLKKAKVNRDLFIKHSENFNNKLNKYGWLLPITISSKGLILEGQHRVEAAKRMNQKTIPAYIVNWLNDKNEIEVLNTIISLNNSNRGWNTINYLKSFKEHNKDYKIVYEAVIENKNTITSGNMIHIYFGKTVRMFKEGKSKILNLQYAKYLCKNISNLVSKYGKTKIQAYQVREIIIIANSKANADMQMMDYLFREYDKMAQGNHPALTSIAEFRPYIERELNSYLSLIK
tara:strand:- start:663 stop:1409 length:747 start_codon:yes stop_codon:yes gene_type:complete